MAKFNFEKILEQVNEIELSDQILFYHAIKNMVVGNIAKKEKQHEEEQKKLKGTREEILTPNGKNSSE